MSIANVTARANVVLMGAAAFWWFVAFLGQWAFFSYIVAFYGPATLAGNFAAWNKGKEGMFFRGYVPGDTAGNLAFGLHALLAAYVAFGGALQLVPRLRSLAPAFHRWNGRLFLATAFGLSLTGLYMVWVRGVSQGMFHSAVISGNAALIILFGGLALRSALRRDFAVHRRWTLRTYVVANGQWFFRVGLFAWIVGGVVLTGHPRYVDPAILVWDFGCYLVPLAVVEVYLRVKEGAAPRARYALAGGLAVLTLLMGAGIAAFSVFTWKQFLS